MDEGVKLLTTTHPKGKRTKKQDPIPIEGNVLEFKPREKLLAKRKKSGLNLGKLLTPLGFVED